ncbi:MAG: hypothetical protein AAFQ63_13735 [Cyanobacteria bacterium J06621_11]
MSKLKPLAAIALVVVTISFGYSGVGQWVVLLLGALFTAAYIDGKWGGGSRWCDRAMLSSIRLWG